MSLIALERIASDLICPACGAAMQNADGWRCSNAACAAHRDGFPVVDGRPVYIDFERSITERASFRDDPSQQSAERGGIRAMVAAAYVKLNGPNRVAAKNVDRVRQLLNGRARKRLLVIGGASVGSGADRLYNDPAIEMIAFDIAPSKWIQFVADAHAIPLADGSVDAVWIQAVLEHVLDPAKVVAEIERVLAPDGVVYADTPFMQQVHMGAFDFTRYTESGHRWLFRRFSRIDSGVVFGSGAQLAWALDYAARSVTRSRKVGRLVHLFALPLAWLIDRLASQSHAVDGACAVFFLGRKTNVELGPRDMVAYYRGAQT